MSIAQSFIDVGERFDTMQPPGRQLKYVQPPALPQLFSFSQLLAVGSMLNFAQERRGAREGAGKSEGRCSPIGKVAMRRRNSRAQMGHA
jgi:hypothetical protein